MNEHGEQTKQWLQKLGVATGGLFKSAAWARCLEGVAEMVPGDPTGARNKVGHTSQELSQAFRGVRSKSRWRTEEVEGRTLGLWATVAYGYKVSEEPKGENVHRPRPRLARQLSQWSNDWADDFIDGLREFAQPRAGEITLQKFRSLAGLAKFRQDNKITKGADKFDAMIQEAFERLPNLRRLDEVDGFITTWIVSGNTLAEDAYLDTWQRVKTMPGGYDRLVQTWLRLADGGGMPLKYLNQLLAIGNQLGGKVQDWKKFSQASEQLLDFMGKIKQQEEEVAELKAMVTKMAMDGKLPRPRARPMRVSKRRM